MFYTISEVSEMTGVKAHVIRYWEKEFASLRPMKDPSGFRRFRKKDIEQVLIIKKYICEDGFTVAGARKAMKQVHAGAAGSQEKNLLLFGIREELQGLLDVIEEYKKRTAN